MSAPPADATRAALEPGCMVDHFRVERLLGRGGTGAVYMARDTKLGRAVALKVVAPNVFGGTRLRDAFMREATITASFNHPHIVTIYAVGEHGGLPYLALEYLEGETLQERAARERPFAKETMRLGHAIAEALAEAHAHGVLHRDLKPENVYLARDGRVRVLDFGVARQLGQEAAPPGGIPPSLAGTPTYVAPELWMGDGPTTASDVWSLGVLLYELLEGRPPFEGADTYELAQRILDEDAPPLSADHPRVFAEVISGCLQKRPRERPAAEAIAKELRSPVQVTTVTSEALRPTGAPRVPTLTILHHPDPTRVGERAVLRALTKGKHVKISRLSPRFEGGATAAPLNDAHLSRRPSFLEGTDGGVRLVANDAATAMRLDGMAVTASRELSDAELECGVVMELGDRVVLCVSVSADEAPSPQEDDLGLPGVSRAARDHRRRVRLLAPMDATVVVAGPRGTPTEAVARALHRGGSRSTGAFVSVASPAEMVAISERLVEGTVFCDVDATDVPTSAWRALSAQPNARLILGTTSMDHEVLARALDGYVLAVPPLSARREDLGLLLYRHLKSELAALGRDLTLLSADRGWVPSWLVAAAARHNWPGNEGQLRQVARRLALDWSEAPVIPRVETVQRLVAPRSE